MHDITDLESRGIPGVFIASSEFSDAAGTQARALGSDPDAVYIPHPIQDRTDDEIRELADNALDAILKSIFETAVNQGGEPVESRGSAV